MEIKEIAESFIKLMPDETENYTGGRNNMFKYYNSVHGEYNKNYFHVYFRSSDHEGDIIEVAHTTDDPNHIIKLIKHICIDVKIKFYEVVKTTNTKYC